MQIMHSSNAPAAAHSPYSYNMCNAKFTAHLQPIICDPHGISSQELARIEGTQCDTVGHCLASWNELSAVFNQQLQQ
jgi:hypothetical protein